MSKIGILCTDGVEEVECLTVVDFCRRAGIGVEMISMTGRRQIMGSHQIHFIADAVYEDAAFSEFDGIVLPGGPGTAALAADTDVKELVREFYAAEKLVAAICAAPSILAELGLLKGKKATGYPGFKKEGAALWSDRMTEKDGNVITGKGPGAASLFALEIIRYLSKDEAAAEVRGSVMMDEDSFSCR